MPDKKKTPTPEEIGARRSSIAAAQDIYRRADNIHTILEQVEWMTQQLDDGYDLTVTVKSQTIRINPADGIGPSILNTIYEYFESRYADLIEEATNTIIR